MLRLLRLDLIAVKPDLLLGLNPDHIQVRVWDGHGAILADRSKLQEYILSRSVMSSDGVGWEGEDVVVESSDGQSRSISSQNIFPA